MLFCVLILFFRFSVSSLFLTGLSVDGDSQGVGRFYGAVSAHMWPGMVLKSGDKINEPSLPEQEGNKIILL